MLTGSFIVLLQPGYGHYKNSIFVKLTDVHKCMYYYDVTPFHQKDDIKQYHVKPVHGSQIAYIFRLFNNSTTATNK